MHPLTDYFPKPSLPLLDVPLGLFGLTDLASLGGPLYVNVSHRATQVRRALALPGQDVGFLVEQPTPVGSAATVAALKERLEGPLVTRNADALTDLAVRDLVTTHIASGAAATIAVRPVTEEADLSVVEGFARGFIDRRTESVPGHQWLGLGVFERHALDRIDLGRGRDLATGLLLGLIATGDVAVHEHHGYFRDVGTPLRYLEANLDVLEGRIAFDAQLPGDIVRVDGGTAYVGPDTTVAGDLSAGAVVMQGATIERGARIGRSLVLPGEHIPNGVELEDAIWFRGAELR